MPGIGVITNPYSRRNRRHPERMRRLGYVLGQHDRAAQTERIDEIDEVALRFRDQEIDVLALNGGDGTNHITLTRFIRAWGDHPLPKIALLRGGTMNTVANGLGVRGTPQLLLANLVDAYYTRRPLETVERDVLAIDDGSGSERYGFIFGNGIIANFMEAYYGSGRPSPTTAAWLLARAAAQVPVGGELARRLFRPFRASISFDEGGAWKERSYDAVLASTQEQIGLGFRPFVRCEERTRSFHLLATVGTPADLLAALPDIRLGRPVDQGVVRDEVSARAEVRCDEPFSYTLDGDMYAAPDGRLMIGVGPRIELVIK